MLAMYGLAMTQCGWWQLGLLRYKWERWFEKTKGKKKEKIKLPHHSTSGAQSEAEDDNDVSGDKVSSTQRWSWWY